MRHLAISVFLAAAQAAEITSAFEGGSTGKVERVSPAHFRVDAKGETDQNGRNRQANWYYFRVDSAPRSEMIFDVVNLPGEYNFKPNRGAITKDTPPVISFDGRNWRHLKDFEYEPNEPKLRLRVKPASSRFWIAHTPPYTGKDLEALRKMLPRGAETVIGKSVGGRPIYLWTLGSGAKTVWLMFRQHAWESGTSWVADGAVRELARDPRGITWKILPMCDPDGVARGGVRFNSNGFDLNRNWDTLDERRMPEIFAQHRAVADWVRAGRNVDLFLTLHNTETSEYLEGGPVASSKEVGERLFRVLRDQTTFDPSRPLSLASAAEPGRASVVQGLGREFGIPAFLMEQRVSFNSKLGKLPGVAERTQFGRELVEAIRVTLH